jgi:RNA polymerase sigma-70 factor (ECF subfamily)
MSDQLREPPSDEVLLDRVRREGATSPALDELLDKYRPYLRRIADCRMDNRLRRRFDPSDVVQEALLVASRRIDAYLDSPPMSFHLWLRQVVKDHLAVLHRGHLQTQCRNANLELPLPERSSRLRDKAFCRGESPSQQVQQQELADLIREAIASLEPHDAEIILLRLLWELSNEEAAEVLGLTPEVVKKRYARALVRLKQEVKNLTPGGSTA